MEHKDTHNNTVSLKDGVTMSLSVHVGDNMIVLFDKTYEKTRQNVKSDGFLDFEKTLRTFNKKPSCR